MEEEVAIADFRTYLILLDSRYVPEVSSAFTCSHRFDRFPSLYRARLFAYPERAVTSITQLALLIMVACRVTRTRNTF